VPGEPAGAAALRGRAAEAPEDPWIFFRGGRGHFRWWSHARALEALDGAPAGDLPAGAAVAREAVERLRAAGEDEALSARALLGAIGPGPQRDIWISWRPFDRREERVALVAAALAGWAILREPGEGLHPSVLAWARPTLLVGGAGELETLLAGFEAEAPRAFRARWLRRRLARLRAVVVDDGAPVEALARRLVGLGAETGVVSPPPRGW
jgi:hypothetical protein